MEIIQITDLHISKNKSESKHDCVPYKRLAKVLEHISANNSQNSNLVITGYLSSDFKGCKTGWRLLLKNIIGV